MNLRAGFSIIFIVGCLSSAAVSQGSWVTKEGYPKRALREGREGTTYFKIVIGVDGRAKNCAVTQSSGSQDLDEATCKIMLEKAHFQPAGNAKGEPMEDVYENRFVWKIPQ